MRAARARIVEQNDATRARRDPECNTGVMARPAQPSARWLGALKSDNAQGEYYLTDVFAMAVTSRPARSLPLVASDAPEVLGVNDRVQLAQLERAYHRRRAEELMRAGATLADPARFDLRGEVAAAATSSST